MPEAPERLLSRTPGRVKVSKPYRTSGLTVKQYMALPHAERLAVNAECDKALTFTEQPHESGRPLWVGTNKKPS